MKQLGLLVLAIALGVTAWWWFSQEMPKRAQERVAAAHAAAVEAERATSLYRWYDDRGTMHVTQDPPKGRKFERISKTPKDGMEVHGARD